MIYISIIDFVVRAVVALELISPELSSKLLGNLYINMVTQAFEVIYAVTQIIVLVFLLYGISKLTASFKIMSILIKITTILLAVIISAKYSLACISQIFTTQYNGLMPYLYTRSKALYMWALILTSMLLFIENAALISRKKEIDSSDSILPTKYINVRFKDFGIIAIITVTIIILTCSMETVHTLNLSVNEGSYITHIKRTLDYNLNSAALSVSVIPEDINIPSSYIPGHKELAGIYSANKEELKNNLTIDSKKINAIVDFVKEAPLKSKETISGNQITSSSLCKIKLICMYSRPLEDDFVGEEDVISFLYDRNNKKVYIPVQLHQSSNSDAIEQEDGVLTCDTFLVLQAKTPLA